MNHLTEEKSPYLLQHKDNLVDWYPWGKEAFRRARAEDKPVFLSIGYSTCHWCHVMAHESFEDGDVAEILNRNFICIKVDREERPDIDAVYMQVCQALTGSGGWPLTVIMTPEQKPFWAGTYLPKTFRYGRTGLTELLSAVAQEWRINKDKILSSSDKILSLIDRRQDTDTKAAAINKEVIYKAEEQFRKSYDERWGGFGSAPKFPSAHNLLFLLRYSVLEQDETALEMAEHTLAQMYRGGIFDHIGGGFSRYSTDEKWLAPHFEKMLYDNALLAIAYTEAYEITQNALYRSVADRIFDYVLRELTDGQGGFYCGQDADSDGVEGMYYLHTPEEIRQTLGEGGSDLFCRWFDITEQGNFEGKNIPNLIKNPHFKENNEMIKSFCEKILEYRVKRARLHKDDKILTSWNALMIIALTKAAKAFDKPEYLDAAIRARRFISTQLSDGAGRLFIRWREGGAANSGQLDDYAFYALALLELYQNNFDIRFLKEAVSISNKMLELFFDEKNGGFYIYASDGEQLITRPKETYDGAMPSGNSVAATVLIRLYKLTGNKKWQQALDKHLDYVYAAARDYPIGHGFLMLAFTELLYPSKELICAAPGKETPKEFSDFLKELPGLNISAVIKTKENERELAEIAPFTSNYPVPEKEPIYYLCQNGACAAPIKSVSGLAALIR